MFHSLWAASQETAYGSGKVLQECLDEIDELPEGVSELIVAHVERYWSRKENG